MEKVTRRKMIKNSMVTAAGWSIFPSELVPLAKEIPAGTGSVSFLPDWNHAGSTLRHTWEGLGNVDQFRWFVRRDMQDQLAVMQKDLNLRHVRAVGMFDDELRVLGIDPTTWRDQDRKARYNWQVIDYVIESLMNMGINPVITTSFMPSGLSSGTQTCFSTKANVCPPKDYREWTDLVTRTIRHFVERFGESVVKSWYFEVWNEPNLDAFWKGADKAEFFKLYSTTWQAIKSVHPDLRLGGPSAARAEWIPEFIDFGRKNGCPADYIIAHVYNNDSEFAALSPFDGPQNDKINQSPNFLPGVVKGTRKLLDEMGFKGELHFNEWGRSWFPSDSIRESQNEAAFIVKSMAGCSQHADYFAYWCLSDIYDQLGYGSETFHGNYGLMNLQGLKKPSYKAFQLLGKLGDTQVPLNTSNGNDLQNAIAAKGKNGYQFLFYSFEKDFKPETSVPQKMSVSFRLPDRINIDDIRVYRIGSTENNIFSKWKSIGSPAYLRKEELAELLKHNDLGKSGEKHKIDSTGGSRVMTVECESPGVALVEMNTNS
jgi:xylan 1,4-beta-xylosidase